ELGARAVHFHLDCRSVLAPAAEGVVEAADFPGDALADVLTHEGPVGGIGELLDGNAAARELLARVPEDLAELRVGEGDAPVLDDIDAGDRLLDQRAEAVLGWFQRLFAPGRSNRFLLRPVHPRSSSVN